MTELCNLQSAICNPPKAITLHPVWAWAVIHGPKRVENRTWATRHRGPLLIHAGGGNARADAEARAILEGLGVAVPDDDALPRGVLLGTVELVDVVRLDRRQGELFDLQSAIPDPQSLATGPVCWILAGPRPLARPVPCRGRRRLFRVEA